MARSPREQQLEKQDLDKLAFFFLCEYGGKGFALYQMLGPDKLLTLKQTPEAAKVEIEKLLDLMLQYEVQKLDDPEEKTGYILEIKSGLYLRTKLICRLLENMKL